jgi:hypothetical protein
MGRKSVIVADGSIFAMPPCLGQAGLSDASVSDLGNTLRPGAVAPARESALCGCSLAAPVGHCQHNHQVPRTRWSRSGCSPDV